LASGGPASGVSTWRALKPFTPAMIPWAMLDAPNRMKQPNTTCTARLTSIRPVNIRYPTEATATTAAVVAIEPSNAPCNQATAEPIGVGDGESVYTRES